MVVDKIERWIELNFRFLMWNMGFIAVAIMAVAIGSDKMFFVAMFGIIATSVVHYGYWPMVRYNATRFAIWVFAWPDGKLFVLLRWIRGAVVWAWVTSKPIRRRLTVIYFSQLKKRPGPIIAITLATIGFASYFFMEVTDTLAKFGGIPFVFLLLAMTVGFFWAAVILSPWFFKVVDTWFANQEAKRKEKAEEIKAVEAKRKKEEKK